MRSVLKFLHLVGMALFLGSLPAHIVLGSVGPGGDIPVQGLFFSRMMIQVVTLVATLPGLLLAVGSGLILAWPNRRQRRLWLHGGLGILALLNAATFIVPQVFAMTELARSGLESGQVDLDRWHGGKMLEDVAGAINLAAGLLAVAVACWRRAVRAG